MDSVGIGVGVSVIPIIGVETVGDFPVVIHSVVVVVGKIGRKAFKPQRKDRLELADVGDGFVGVVGRFGGPWEDGVRVVGAVGGALGG